MLRAMPCGSLVIMRGLRTATPLGAADQVQQLFMDKVKEYKTKSASAGGKFVDETAEDRKSLADEMDRVAKTFRIQSQKEAETFPTFAFKDPAYDSIHVADAAQK